MPEILQLLVSPHHRYAGRPDLDLTEPPDETRDHIELRAGLGIVGDRYFNRPAHADASITLITSESLAPWPGSGLHQCRRNVLLHGVDVDAAARGSVLSLDSGDGPVLLRVNRPAHPCAWMDARIAPGAWKALRGHAGVRCVPLTDGLLRVGPVSVGWTGLAALLAVPDLAERDAGSGTQEGEVIHQGRHGASQGPDVGAVAQHLARHAGQDGGQGVAEQ